MKLKVIHPNPSNYIPPVLKNKYIDTEGILEAMLRMTIDSEDNFFDIPINFLLNGQHGMGKSLLISTFREELTKKAYKKYLKQRKGPLLDEIPFTASLAEIPMVDVNCTIDTKDFNLRGLSQAVGNETPFVLGPLPSAIHLANTCGVCILNLEEINTLPPGAQKILNSITDWQKRIHIPQINENFRLAEGCKLIVCASMNPSGFGGVNELNPDFRSRFAEFRITYPDIADQVRVVKKITGIDDYSNHDLLTNLSTIARQSQSHEFDYKISTRDIVKFVYQYSRLLDYSQEYAMNTSALCLLNKFEGTQRALAADRIDGSLKTKLSLPPNF